MSAPIWTTPSDLGSAISLSAFTLTIEALAVAPATSVTYAIISGTLPPGFTLVGAILSGTMPTVSVNTSYAWTIRARDNLGNFRDRSFTLVSTPQTPAYFTDVFTLVTSPDSTWIERAVLYYNPDPAQPVAITLESGALPTGLILEPTGVIRGYAQAPVLGLTVSAFSHTVSSISTTVLRTSSTSPLQAGAQITYATSSGNIVAGRYYYIREILNSTDYTITEWQYGNVFAVGSVVGITGNQQAGTPTTPVRRSSLFSLKLTGTLGFDLGNFEIQIINQNLPVAQGGPGLPANTRIPAIVNSQEITPTPDADWYPYLLPPPRSPATQISVGSYSANQDLAFHILGYDFDSDALTYIFTGLPAGLTGDASTGWITGQVLSGSPSITTYSFTVQVQKTLFPAVTSPVYNFGIQITNDVVNDITWTGSTDLGMLTNCQISELSVAGAQSQSQTVFYRLATGSSLPANLSLNSDGLIVGKVADQPTNGYLKLGDITTFTFTVEAYNPAFPLAVSSTQTFTLKILQAFDVPNENLYYRALCDFNTRRIVSNALNDPDLIPPSSLYRPSDPYFGLSTYIWFTQAYGIVSSSVDEYITALKENHYWRNVTLGQIETARATDAQGTVIYEVVYSRIIDNLVNNQGVSIPQTITWPRIINYGINPWAISSTTVYTSYIQILTQLYFTALTQLQTDRLHPASLPDMRQRVIDICGAVPTQLLLPKWMTSQQENGAALGYIPAWVICYTLPGKSAQIADNLRNSWDYVLNQVDFSLDRVFVDRSSTYNLQPNLAAETWLTLPSANPVPIPQDRYDRGILFPQSTILPPQ